MLAQAFVSVVWFWFTRGTQGCTVNFQCYSYAIMSSTPHTYPWVSLYSSGLTQWHAHSHTSEPAGEQSFADSHCTSSHSLTVTCICALVKTDLIRRCMVTGYGANATPTIHLSPLQWWMRSSLSSSPFPHTPSLHALCPVSPSRWTPTSSEWRLW